MSTENIIIWPDGTWCYSEELEQFNWKSDDYTVILNTSDNFVELVMTLTDVLQSWEQGLLPDEDKRTHERVYKILKRK